MEIQFKRGAEQNRSTITPKVGEPLFTTDNKEMFIGDGATVGGVPIGTVKPAGTIVKDMLAAFVDSTGKLIKGISKSELLTGYPTDSQVDSKIASNVPTIKVNSAAHSDTATNASQLNGKANYILTDAIVNSYQDTSKTKVASAFSLSQLFTTLTSSLAGKIDKSVISASTTSTSSTNVASSSAVKGVRDLVDVVTNSINTLTQTVTSLSSHVNSEIQSVTSKTQTNANSITGLTASVGANTQHLARLPYRLTRGIAAPSGGIDGDVYIQYR